MCRGRSVLVALALASVVACSGGSTAEPPPLRIDLVDAALVALHDRLGEDVAFFEVNATAQVVNLFVAVEGMSVVQYIYDGASLVGPTEPRAATGTMFERGLVNFDDDVLAPVLGELPDSRPTMFVITGAGTDPVALRVEYRVLMRSDKGGELAIVVDSDGAIVGTDAE
ncbi:MAG: hypothetical protein ACKOCE_06925 [Acidimicrobiia bacterium]